MVDDDPTIFTASLEAEIVQRGVRKGPHGGEMGQRVQPENLAENAAADGSYWSPDRVPSTAV